MSTESKITVEQLVSAIGRRRDQRATLEGLGLRKIGSRAVVLDTPAARGMIAKVKHLVRVVEGE